MDVIESLAGMVSSMLEFPLVGFLGRLVPAGGSEAGQQVRRVCCLLLLQVFNLRKAYHGMFERAIDGFFL